MKSGLILLILLFVFVAGCIAPEIQPGNPSDYELPGLINTTIFYLNISSVQVVDNVINANSSGLILTDNAETNFMNPVAVDYSGKNVTFNISTESVLGKNYARFNFDKHFSGFVAFSRANGQDFNYEPTKNGTIRVVLPENYTAFSTFLGVAQPKPDNVTHDAKGREVLTWDNPYPEQVRVKYNQIEAQTILLYFLFILSITAALVMGYYFMSISALKKKRTEMEKGIKK